MKENALELVFILDASGSMHNCTDDTVGGFNSTLDKQKEDSTEVMLSTVLFNSHIQVLHDRIPASEAAHMTRADYTAYGSTALYDAIGRTIRHIEDVHRYIRPEDVPEKTLFVIMTDGMENASREFSGAMVKELIDKKKKDGWEFLFLAADIDTYEAASRIGIDHNRAASFHKHDGGFAEMYCCVETAIDSIKYKKLNGGSWKKMLEKNDSEKELRDFLDN